MHGLRGRAVAATVAAGLLLATSTMLLFPASASAEDKTVPCGSEVTAKPGDHIYATDPLLGVVPLDLGVVTKDTNVLTGTINALLGTVCTVTVKVVETVVEPVPGVGEPAADALKQGTKDLTGAAQGTVDTLGSALAPSSPQPDDQSPQPSGPPADPDRSGTGGSDNSGSGRDNGDTTALAMPAPDSRAFGGGVPLSSPFLPTYFSTGYAPMRDYSGIPIAMPGLYAPSAGIRYGSQIPGYAPEFGILDSNGPKSGQGGAPEERVSKVGDATALAGAPASGGNPASLPVLLAVIALTASTAALVRTWVLRKA